MTDKELQKLKRIDLLEVLLEQSKTIDDLRVQLQAKDNEIASLNKKLEERKIEIQEAGSIAEAAIKLNGVFEAAEKAAQQYLENVERKCREREEAAENKCAYLEAKAKEVVDERWNELSTKLEEFYKTHEGIRELLTMTKMGI